MAVETRRGLSGVDGLPVETPGVAARTVLSPGPFQSRLLQTQTALGGLFHSPRVKSLEDGLNIGTVHFKLGS